ncbi:hypothetical protein BJ165DRAFT_699570 [Panaeolus papilionaceus]|nr:hypothetical protein BJ165DRAFT_699570 [Panaeolus papilionaceus]
MRFTTFVAAAAIAFTAVEANPNPAPGLTPLAVTGFDLTPQSKFNAPSPPWVKGAKPGWYNGKHPQKYPFLPCVSWWYNPWLCQWLKFWPWAFQCPPKYPPPKPTTSKTTSKPASTSSTPTPTSSSSSTAPTPTPTAGYTPTFQNITGAIQADDYLTFGLVDTLDDCIAMCNGVSGCNFFNIYHDVNGKDGSPDFTCSLFGGCHGPEAADNVGGQTQPDGSVNFIRDSSGFCKL